MPLAPVHDRHIAAAVRLVPLAGSETPSRHVVDRVDDDAVHGPAARGLVADLADGDLPACFRTVALPVRGRARRAVTVEQLVHPPRGKLMSVDGGPVAGR
jgi:hypothetical protein